MWFKCGQELLQSAIMRDLGKGIYERDNYGRQRKYTFLLLLSETAEDRAEDLQDAEDLARLVDTTPRQAQIVWDVLVKHNALRQGAQGYSVRAWMIERGILGDTRKWQGGEKHGENGQYRPESKNSFFTGGGTGGGS
jgi:hypothetical protein